MDRNKGFTRKAFLITSACSVPLLTGCVSFRFRKDCPVDLKGDSISLALFRESDNFFAFLEIYGFCVKERFNRYYLQAFERTKQADRMLVFTFPPQHFSESALDKSKLDKINTSEAAWNAEIDELLSSIELISSKSSTLVFQVPDNRDALPHSGKIMPLELEHLLSWEYFDYVTEDVKNPYNKDDIFPPPISSKRNFLLGYETWKGKGKSQVSAIDMPAGFYLQPYTQGKTKPYRWQLTTPKDEDYVIN